MKPFSFMTACTLLAQTLTIHLFSDSTSAANTQNNPPATQTNIRGQLQPISASASVDKGWVVDGSFLYWNAKSDGYQFAEKIHLKGLSTTSAPTFIDGKAKLISPSFNEWDPGVQLGLGYIFPQREQWLAHLSWTHLNTDSDRTVSADPSQIPNHAILPTLIPLLTGTLADRASGHWRLHFNTLDFELSRQFYIGKWLSIRPKMGLRAAWINQRFNVKYHSIFVTTDGAFPFDQSFSCHQEFNGIGMKFGSDLQFYMTKAWSILGNLSTSLLWGSTELKQKATGRIFVDTTNSFPETIRFSKSVDKIRTNLEGQLGLQWQTYYHQGKYRFAMSALYSFAYWFCQNQLTNHSITPSPNLQQPAIVDSNVNGDLQLQGLNLQLEFDF